MKFNFRETWTTISLSTAKHSYQTLLQNSAVIDDITLSLLDYFVLMVLYFLLEENVLWSQTYQRRKKPENSIFELSWIFSIRVYS